MLPLMLLALTGAPDQAWFVATPPTESVSPFYVGRRKPLLPAPLLKLPPGSVRPRGWLRNQLELQRDGFSGRLAEISSFLKRENNAWLQPKATGRAGWEELPYWLKGQLDLGIVLGDDAVLEEAKFWIEATLNSQREDGYFGPEVNLESQEGGKPDLWPNMIMLFALQSYYEATNDPRVPKLMLAYFRWVDTIPEQNLLVPYWQWLRGGDMLHTILWLYDRTGEPSLLPLAEKIHRNTADWTTGVHDPHGVNIAQGFREPATHGVFQNDPKGNELAWKNLDEVRDEFGQFPGGLYGADENFRKGYRDPRQATETCTMVEAMLSAEILLGYSADPAWGDLCEEVAFNDLPASMTVDLKGLRYLTAANMPQSDSESKSPGIQNSGPMYLFDPRNHRCCQHNVSHGWPYFAEHLWMATTDAGLAATLYAPGDVRAKVAGGMDVEIRLVTQFPFEDLLKFEVEPSAPASFPLYFRVPAWARGHEVSLNGAPLQTEGEAKGWLRIERTWNPGDELSILWQPEIEKVTWKDNHDSVSVRRGPLWFSLAIDEKAKKLRAKDEWPATELFAGSPWNYAIDAQAPITLERAGTIAKQPFALGDAPLWLETKGKRVPEWKLDENGLVQKLQASPVATKSPTENIRLVPLGAARLRVSAFPVAASTPSEGVRWTVPPVPLQARASHRGGSLSALTDGLEPRSSAELEIPRFTWWDHLGTREWVEIDLGKTRKLESVSVYWFDDEPSDGKCRLPQTWTVKLWDQGETFTPAELQVEPAGKNRYCVAKFAASAASRVRIEVQLREGVSAGILEVRID